MASRIGTTTLAHIAQLLELLDRHGEAIVDATRWRWRSSSTTRSTTPPGRQRGGGAALAAARLAALGLPSERVGEVVRYILATRHGRSAAGIDEADLALLLDLDLSILGAAPAEYCAYAEAIRREYASVPDGLYRAGRRRVLEDFLARERIYRTGRLSVLWEGPARANLADEVARLERGVQIG
jgi:predicted metal-dependent HD superfamily phosphohydrolase